MNLAGARLRFALTAASALWTAMGHVSAASIPAPHPGLVESGAPPFVVLGADSLGLDGAPTDLQILPDGRLLLIAPRQLTLGDGVRWQTFVQDPMDPHEAGIGGVADRDGTIYIGTPAGIAAVRFSDDGRWRLEVASPWNDANQPVVTLAQSACTTTVEGDWIWHSLSGPVVSWRPGRPPQTIAAADTLEHVFALNGTTYVGDRFNGRLMAHAGAADGQVLEPGTSMAVTSSQPFDEGYSLVGTYAAGVMRFDGRSYQALATDGPLSGGARINAICRTEGGYFAAAIDNLGIIFFTRDGRTVQSLDRALDHRLARVKKLHAGPAGTLWGLLEDGLVRIEFPVSVSNFEPHIGTGITTVHPFRVDGRLWMLANGRAHRAVYDSDGRLQRFEADTPGRNFVTSFSGLAGPPIAGTEHGAFWRSAAGWQAFAPETKNLRLLAREPGGDRWLYAAQYEIGWIRLVDDRPTIVERLPAAGLTNSFNVPVFDDSGRIVLELGSGRVAVVNAGVKPPVVSLLGAPAGISPSWAQTFSIDGRVGVNLSNTLVRLDTARNELVPDPQMLGSLPGVDSVFGRPGVDALGRLWVSADGSVHLFERRDGKWQLLPVTVPVEFQPYFLTFQDDGVVWMHAQHRLARYDPAVPAVPPRPLSARITHVTLPADDRHIFSPAAVIDPLDFEDNSLIVHFIADGHTLAAPATFEVRLEGSGGDWFSTGADGSAAFNRLAEGHYVLHVRPRNRVGVGDEVSMAFTIRPPWFRTKLAYALYAFSAFTVIFGVLAVWSWLARREQHRLERLVTERTGELRSSEERFRHLNEELEQRVDQRTRELHQANARLHETNRELKSTNDDLESFSYSVSHDLRAPLRGIDGWSLALLEDYGEKLDTTALTYLRRVRTECHRLNTLIDDLLKLSRTTRADFHRVSLDLSRLAQETAGRVAETRPQTQVEFSCQPGLQSQGDPALLAAALFNLFDNAWKFSSKTSSAMVEFGLTETDRGPAFFVRDNGAGFNPRHARKLFGVFQRMHTQDEFPGTGIGLATVQRIIHRHGGKIWAESDVGAGATFYFTLPTDASLPPDSPTP